MTKIELKQKEVEAVLHLIQRFDPVGSGARSLQECLQVQLNQMPSDTPYLPEAKIVVLRYLELLGNKDFTGIMRKARLKEDVLKEIIALIQTLHPPSWRAKSINKHRITLFLMLSFKRLMGAGELI